MKFTLTIKKATLSFMLIVAASLSAGGVMAYTQIHQANNTTEIVYTTSISPGAIEGLLGLETGTVQSARRSGINCTVIFTNPLETLTHELYNNQGEVIESRIEIVAEPKEWRMRLLDEYMAAKGCGVR